MIESKCVTTYSLNQQNVIIGTYETCSYNLGSLEKAIDTIFTWYNLWVVSIIVSVFIFFKLYKRFVW